MGVNNNNQEETTMMDFVAKIEKALQPLNLGRIVDQDDLLKKYEIRFVEDGQDITIETATEADLRAAVAAIRPLIKSAVKTCVITQDDRFNYRVESIEV